MGTSGVSSPTGFTGNSAFSSDLAQVISRAVSIASLPMQQLQGLQSKVTGQQTELQTLSGQFQSLQSAIDGINNSVGFGLYSASVGNNSVLSANTRPGVAAGTYTLNVTSTGTQTNTISANGLTTVADPATGDIDSSTTYSLTVNGQSFQVTDSDGSLSGLASAINASGANVQATIVNVGSSSAPDYRLSIQGLDYAPDSIQLSDGTNDLLSTLSTGSYVTYQVDGQPSTPINSSSRNLTISPGLTVSVLQAGATSVMVSQSGSGVSNALSSFANTYNTLVDEVSKSRGQNGGALSGQSIVYSLSDVLRNIANYNPGSGSTASLADLGLSFDQNGHLQFDSGAFAQNTATSLNNALSLLGSESGGGFLQAANSLIASVTDPTTGLLPQENQATSDELASLGQKISADQDQISQLQQNLTKQMAAADALISSLEQQVTQITNLFSAMQQASKSITG